MKPWLHTKAYEFTWTVWGSLALCLKYINVAKMQQDPDSKSLHHYETSPWILVNDRKNQTIRRAFWSFRAAVSQCPGKPPLKDLPKVIRMPEHRTSDLSLQVTLAWAQNFFYRNHIRKFQGDGPFYPKRPEFEEGILSFAEGSSPQVHPDPPRHREYLQSPTWQKPPGRPASWQAYMSSSLRWKWSMHSDCLTFGLLPERTRSIIV